MLLGVAVAFGGALDEQPTPSKPEVDEVERSDAIHATSRKHSRSVRHVERKPDAVPADTRAESEPEAVSAEVVTEAFTMEVTAYTAGFESTGKRPGDVGYGVTASGRHVQAGVTIACPPSMAFGTKLRIEGVGVRICHDRGGHIVEGRLDVYMPDLQDALDFGRQDVRVEIVNGGAE